MLFAPLKNSGQAVRAGAAIPRATPRARQQWQLQASLQRWYLDDFRKYMNIYQDVILMYTRENVTSPSNMISGYCFEEVKGS